ncbi:efflux RND transporter permease subunit [Dichotomicrobium thermohalophilum]|uniref:Efflux pump membrane transporter n=1 Tax=Dichotomicrobium thermohalophilum TaxID=933063 RepID=A0A397Q3S6_9HYPH|nr:efflux RND transporter permease subunit [Dichotomicrobium thermohalophilum]RIA55772.1 HAE1 family hydrophobic/amphiphilic exporter-1 [Dichotomicrobium thermohalophilum]
MIHFFISRPIFASVIALILVIFGGVALLVLPVSRYPNVIPPQVRTTATFTGGDAATVADTVATPLEQAINGVDNLIYIQSTSSNDGVATVSATFAVGTDPDIASVDVLTEVNEARPQLPPAARDRGITIETASPQITAVISLVGQTERFDELFLSNYATINIVDRIRRLEGVGRVVNFTRRDYAMRIWLDPAKLDYFKLDPVDVITAIREQNAPFAGGAIGAEPAPEGQDFSYTVSTKGRLETAEQFKEIVLRARPDGTVVTVGDVARVELGAESYGSAAHYSGNTAAQIGIFQAPDANALELLSAINAEMEEISQRFPDGIRYEIGFDTSRFVTAAVQEVVKTLGFAILLVVLVVFVFLQKWRATMIPSLVIPIALMGSFGLMYLLGFSVNQLTLLGLILAVGLVVDDAIVVVENVNRHLSEGEARETATRSAMSEVIGPIIATTAVLFALFVPVAFIPGISGLLYNQFSLTVAIAVGLSTLMSLTLTPALSRVILKPATEEPALPFRWFNRGFDAIRTGYVWLLRWLLRLSWLVFAAFIAIVAVTVVLFVNRPTGFVPSEDQGYFIVNVQLPEAASFQRTRDVVFDIEDTIQGVTGVRDVVAIAGSSFVGNVNAPNFGFLIPILESWTDRPPDQNVNAIIADLRKQFAGYQDAQVQIFNAPPIPGVGSTGGVRLQLQGLEYQDPKVMAAQAQSFIDALNERPEVGRAFTTFSAGVPQIDFTVNRERAEQAGVPIGRLFNTSQAFLGSTFVNEFNKFGQTYRVFVQADTEARDSLADIAMLKVRNASNDMVPLETLIDAEYTTGPQAVSRYNLYPAVEIQAQPAPGISSGELVAGVEETAAENLPGAFGYEWTGAVFQQKQAAGWSPIIFTLAVLLVFLVLGAQFESLSLPFVVVLAVPFAAFGAISGLAIAGLDLDIFGQIGLLMLVGLSAKNAILIVQFARAQKGEAMGSVDAVIEAARLRLRPILMTALSFILGVMPLIISTGAGANARISLGVTVVSGMLAATILSLLMVPVIYVLIERLRASFARRKGEAAAQA